MATDQDKIIAAAKEVGAYRYINRAAKDEPTHTFTIEQLIAFYAIAFEAGRQAELEECAKVCENNYWSEEIDWWLRATKKDVSAKAARKFADAIRAEVVSLTNQRDYQYVRAENAEQERDQLREQVTLLRNALDYYANDGTDVSVAQNALAATDPTSTPTDI